MPPVNRRFGQGRTYKARRSCDSDAHNEDTHCKKHRVRAKHYGWGLRVGKVIFPS